MHAGHEGAWAMHDFMAHRALETRGELCPIVTPRGLRGLRSSRRGEHADREVNDRPYQRVRDMCGGPPNHGGQGFEAQMGPRRIHTRQRRHGAQKGADQVFGRDSRKKRFFAPGTLAPQALISLQHDIGKVIRGRAKISPQSMLHQLGSIHQNPTTASVHSGTTRLDRRFWCPGPGGAGT